jgi:NAD(P)H-dependent FMN reductase
VKVTAISGSLQSSSGNTALVRAVAQQAPRGIEVRVWDRLLEVPVFNPDVADADIAEVVRDLDAALAASDLILIATPEYGGGMPGVLKNAFDWMVGVSGFDGKAVLVVSAAPNDARGANARRWVEETTRMQGATIVDSFSVAVRNGLGLDEATQRVLDRIAALA